MALYGPSNQALHCFSQVCVLVCRTERVKVINVPRCFTLRKHAYSNILKILQPKKETFQIKNFIFFFISAQRIDCGYSLEPPSRGGSNEYQQSMFCAKIRKNNVYPCKPQFYYIKVGFKGVKII